MDQLTAEFKQETKTLKKKAKRDMQKINQNAAMIQQVYACLLYTSPSPRDRG